MSEKLYGGYTRAQITEHATQPWANGGVAYDLLVDIARLEHELEELKRQADLATKGAHFSSEDSEGRAQERTGQEMIYLASPYSHDSELVRRQRFDAVCVWAGKLMARGEKVFSPIAHTHSLAVMGNLPTGFDYWRDYDEWFISRCDSVAVLMLDGWRESNGVRDEIKIAERMDKPVFYMSATDGVWYTKGDLELAG